MTTTKRWFYLVDFKNYDLIKRNRQYIRTFPIPIRDLHIKFRERKKTEFMAVKDTCRQNKIDTYLKQSKTCALLYASAIKMLFFFLLFIEQHGLPHKEMEVLVQLPGC